jgi:hypothetical protein
MSYLGSMRRKKTTLLHEVRRPHDITHPYKVILRAAAPTPFEARRLVARARQSRHFALLPHDVDSVPPFRMRVKAQRVF